MSIMKNMVLSAIMLISVCCALSSAQGFYGTRTNRDPIDGEIGRRRTALGFGTSVPLAPNNFVKYWYPGFVLSWQESYDTPHLSMGLSADIGTYIGNDKAIVKAINRQANIPITTNDIYTHSAVLMDYEFFLKYYVTPFSDMSWYIMGSIGSAFIWDGSVSIENRSDYEIYKLPNRCKIANWGLHYSFGIGFDYALGNSGLDLFVDARFYQIVGYDRLGNTYSVPVRAGIKLPISVVRIMRWRRW